MALPNRLPRRPPSQAEKVIDTALRLFTIQGYNATTIEDIKLQSDVSVGVIYHHFGSKEGIAGALYVESLHDFQRGLVRAIDLRRPDAQRDIRAGVTHYLQWTEANRERAALMLRRREIEVTAARQEEIARLNRGLFDELEQWRRPLIAADEIRDLPLPLFHAIWFGPAQEYARAVIDGPAPPDTSATAATPALADAAWAALRPG